MNKTKRSKKPHNCRRQPLIGCVVSASMKKAIERTAKRKGLTVSEFIRTVIAKNVHAR